MLTVGINRTKSSTFAPDFRLGTIYTNYFYYSSDDILVLGQRAFVRTIYIIKGVKISTDASRADAVTTTT